ncbi:hypothetical protein SAMN05444000_108116 [Shimia gijangensis]|uniref:26 kDa periplasmic immunogenic protein n=1 Tax=Shimia gijangensis TaxID=1470563 RepID=A0A1M6J610_9RHOB|nr:SIMPL domain-containing protein [Shimia gijangensis]SHJ42077.1 hypothetical protein SAMN05444000_108116 [Shimia gijangensis]
MRIARLWMLVVALASPVGAMAGEITVTGYGRVDRVPDMATITLGVTHQADNAREAVSNVAQTSGAVLTTLREMGIDARDMRTSDLSLQPVWQHSSSSVHPPKVTGYSASNRVSVRVRDLEILGDILGRVTTDGANLFQGLTFGLQDAKPAQDEARRTAVADAKARATLYAEAAGVSLGSVISLSEAGVSAPRPMMMREALASDMAMPVAEGELSLSATVTLVFEIAE